MESKIAQHLQAQLQKLTKPVYVVFPEAYAGSIQDALVMLKNYPQIRTIPLSPAILQTGAFDPLIDSLCDEFWQLTLQYMKKQLAKGRGTQEEIDTFTKDSARKLLYNPLNLSLMLTHAGYADAEVGGFETSTAEHSRKGLYIVNKDPNQENIVCSVTVEFAKPHRIEDQHEGVLREQNFLTIVDPAMGKPSMEYGFISGVGLLKSLLQAGNINEQTYQQSTNKLLDEKNKYIQLKVDQAIAALRMHTLLTGEAAVGAFITHSTAGSDELSPYIRFLREEVIPAIVAGLAKRKDDDPLLANASFIADECQVEAAADPRIARKKASKTLHAGYANVHVCASVVSANQHYKTFLAYEDILSSICWTGFKKPIFDLSRSSPAKDIVYSALSAVLSAKETPSAPDREMWFQKANEIYQTTHSYHVLAINPGSTSTKIALFHDRTSVFNINIDHSKDPNVPSLADFNRVTEYRLGKIMELLAKQNVALQQISCVMGRGGVLDELPGGVYEVNAIMLEHLQTGRNGIHASNLGAMLAKKVAEQVGCKAYIADPVVVDEQTLQAKITGVKGMMRRPRWHALNQKYVAQKWAEENKKSYNSVNLIIAHLGGGISVAAHHNGRVVDVNNALDGEGVFAINRSGALTPVQTLDLVAKYGKEKLYEIITREGGFAMLLGTQDFRTILSKVESGEAEATTYYNAFVYQLAKQICALLPAFYPDQVDHVIFTGGMAFATRFIHDIVLYLPKELASRYSVYAGEFEMEALAYNGMKVLRGQEKPKTYQAGN